MTVTAQLRTVLPPDLVALSGRDLEDARRLLGLLSGETGGRPPGSSGSHQQPSRDGLLHHARRILAGRRRRSEHFGRAMFGEPAWEMLLLLYIGLGSIRMSAGGLAHAAGYSKATTMRWVGYLEKERLVQRELHPTDQRTFFVTLTEKGINLLELYLSDTLS
jgi:DNA-binding MarR family transcriptional regulator